MTAAKKALQAPARGTAAGGTPPPVGGGTGPPAPLLRHAGCSASGWARAAAVTGRDRA